MLVSSIYLLARHAPAEAPVDVPAAPGKALRGKRLTPDHRVDGQAFCWSYRTKRVDG